MNSWLVNSFGIFLITAGYCALKLLKSCWLIFKSSIQRTKRTGITCLQKGGHSGPKSNRSARRGVTRACRECSCLITYTNTPRQARTSKHYVRYDQYVNNIHANRPAFRLNRPQNPGKTEGRAALRQADVDNKTATRGR